MKMKCLNLVIVITFSILSCDNNNNNNNNNKRELLNFEKSTKKKSDIYEKKVVQLDENDDKAKKWLTDFYRDYIKFYLNSPFRKDKDKIYLFLKEVDSIKRMNCTESFFNHQMKDFNKEFDYITNNEFICDKSLESLEIKQKAGLKDVYEISFIAEYPLNELESEYKRIYFDVTIANEKKGFKISKTCCF